MTTGAPTFRKAKVLGATGSVTFVPFGLPLASDDEALAFDILAVVHPSFSEAENARALVVSLPPAGTLPAGVMLVVLDQAREREGFFAKLLPRRRVAAEDACAALLARGYVKIARRTCPNGAGTLVSGKVGVATEPASDRA